MNETLIKSEEELRILMDENLATLVYFSSPTCSVCQVLRPKIMQAVEDVYPSIKKLHVDISITPEIGATYQVLAAPTVIIFFESKEFIRKYRTISVDGLIQEIQRPYSIMIQE